MSDYRVVPVDIYQASGMTQNGSGAVQSQSGQQQGAPTVQSADSAYQSTSATQTTKSTVEPEKSKDALPITNESNVSLKFQIDEETHNITVYIIDRESNRVLRSIPPQELNKLKAGDLLQMLA